MLLASCSNKSGIQWETPIEIAKGGGHRGEWRQNDSAYDYVDDPSVAFDGSGNTLVTWVDQSTKDVLFQIFSRDGYPRHPRALNISRSPEVFSWLPRLAVHGNDVYVLWQEIVFSGGTHGGEAFFARSTDGGLSFAEPLNLSRSRNGDGKGRISEKVWHNGSLDLVVGGDGTIYTAWTEFDGPLWVSRSTDRGATFTPPVRADDRGKPARAPALAVAGDGTLYLAWTVGDDRSADVRLAMSRDRGQAFSPPVVVAASRGYSDAPKLVVDGAGVLHLAWAESSGGPHDDYHVRYARSRDGGHSFEAPRTLTESGAYPMLTLDDGAVYVMWELPKGLGLAYSQDGGRTFSSPEHVAHSVDPGGGWNGSHQGRLMRKLAVHDGRLAIVNSALAHGKGSRVWLVHGERR